MKQYLLLLLFLPLLLIPAFAIPAGTSFEDFCEKKTNNKKTTAADFICELDIFQMKNEIISNSDRITALENIHNPSNSTGKYEFSEDEN